MLTANNQIPVVSSTALSEHDEEEEVIEICLRLQKFTEKLDFVVARLEVVERVEET